MEFIGQFLTVFWIYVQELWLSILIGFVLSGIFFEFVSTKTVEKYLGEVGIRPILLASLTGALLPVCCFGTLPIAVTMKRKGASLGPVLAFLITTPATSVSALAVCWRLLGAGFTIYIFLSVIVMGLVMGFLGNRLRSEGIHDGESQDDCCHASDLHGTAGPSGDFMMKVQRVLKYAFVTLPKEIGLELVIGIAVASFLVVFEPLRNLIQRYFTGILGYVVILAVGLVTYTCSTASVPMADGLMKSGMSSGHAMTFLLAGPITTYSTLLVVRKEFGTKVLVWYVAMICILSTLSGVLYNVLMTGKIF